MERRTRRTIATLAVLGAMLLTVPACSRDKGPDPAAVSSTTTAPPTTATTARPLTPEEEVEAAYLDIMERYFRRLEHPDPDDPTIADFHTGPSLDAVRSRAAELARNGNADRFTANGVPRPRVLEVAVDGERARITNCIIDDVIVVHVEDESVVNDEVGSLQFESTLVQQDRAWKLQNQHLVQRWDDDRGCSGR